MNWFATLVKAVSSLPPRVIMVLTAATETRMAMAAHGGDEGVPCLDPMSQGTIESAHTTELLMLLLRETGSCRQVSMS